MAFEGGHEMNRDQYRAVKAYLALFIMAFAAVSPFTLLADTHQRGDFQRGAKSWSENCGRCHNIRDPQDLRDDEWVTSISHMRIRAGLTGQEARDILTFLQASNTPAPAVAATPVATTDDVTSNVTGLSGATVYAQTCVACHGDNGKGALPGIADFTAAEGPLSQSDDILLQHIGEGFQSPGSTMAMPPRGGNPNLTDADIRAVLGYLRKTFGQ